MNPYLSTAYHLLELAGCAVLAYGIMWAFGLQPSVVEPIAIAILSGASKLARALPDSDVPDWVNQQ